MDSVPLCPTPDSAQVLSVPQKPQLFSVQCTDIPQPLHRISSNWICPFLGDIGLSELRTRESLRLNSLVFEKHLQCPMSYCNFHVTEL